jgi:predicted transcriptional regulator
VRFANAVAAPRDLDPEALDLEMLALIAAMRHVLTSQLHRHFNAERATTTTQRRLKRLSDAGFVERLQFHRCDGGGIPMCYAITTAGRRVLAEHGRQVEHALADASRPTSNAPGDDALRQARHDVHVTGWVLALAGTLAGAPAVICGPDESVLSPPARSHNNGQRPLAPRELCLPGGRTPHDFLRTDANGRRAEVERFDSLRPDAVLRSATPSRQVITDVFVELDDRPAVGRNARKLERYDHFLSGWSVHTKRYGQRAEAQPVVVFVCRDRSRARECARTADAVLCACRAYAGEYPFDWEYPGRRRTLFAAERDVHEGVGHAYGVPPLPPAVRVAAAHGDPRAGELTAEPQELPVAATPTRT